MAKFFIDRPIFAAVISVIIVLAGSIAVGILPVAQYPEITPPTVQVTCQGNYTGSWQQFSSTHTRTADGAGTVTFGNTCYYGYAGSQARVVMGGVASNAITN